LISINALCFLSASAALGLNETGSSSVLLGRGSIGEFRWRVFVHRSRGPRGRHRLCLEALSSEVGGYGGSVFTLCGSIERWPILVAKSSGSGRAERTVFVMAYNPRVTAVRIWLQGHRSRRILLQALSKARARRAGVQSFNYSIFDVAHPFCLVRIVSYDAKGKVVDAGRDMSCEDGR
jgi:hypothetical protein